MMTSKNKTIINFNFTFMRTAFKLIPAALALVALASCSNDDFLSSSTTQKEYSKYTLTVTAEGQNDLTRAGQIEADGKRTPVWQEGDLIRAYNNSLADFDEYTCTDEVTTKSATFAFNGDTPALTTHNYAVFPSDWVNTMGWVKTADGKKVQLQVNIPSTGIDFATKLGDLDADGNEVAANYAPMWGNINNPEGENPDVNLSFLTAVLKVSLSLIPENATKLVVYSPDGPLTGRFNAILNVEDPTESVLAVDEAYSNGNKIEVALDGSEIGLMSGAIYLPILAEQTYKNIVVVVECGAEKTVLANYGPDIAAGDTYLSSPVTSTTPDKWKNGTKYIAKLGGQDFATGFQLARKQHVVLEKTFEAVDTEADSPADVTAVLAKYKNAVTDKLELTFKKSIESKIAGGFDDYIITVPAELKDVDIVLNFAASSDALKIADGGLKVVSEAAGIGSVTLNPTAITDTGSYNVDFSELQEDVVLAGAVEWKNVVAQDTEDLGLYIGDGTQATTLSTALTANKADLVIAKSAKLTTAFGSATTKAVGDVLVAGSLQAAVNTTGDVVIAATGDTTTEGAINTTGDVTIAGLVKANVTTTTGDITVVEGGNTRQHGVTIKTNTGTITVEEGAKANVVTGDAKIIIAGECATISAKPETTEVTVTGIVELELNAGGKVTIDKQKDGEAVEGVAVGKLTLYSATAEITLNNGYVGSIVNDGTSLANWTTGTEEGTIKVDTSKGGLTAIKTVDANVRPYIDFGESKWDGQYVTEATFGSYVTGEIYTASQLASMNIARTSTKNLYANIDLADKDWTARVFTYAGFNGHGKTIKNLNLTNADVAAGVGLFSQVGTTSAAEFTIQNFTLAGVKATKAGVNNIGTVAGVVNNGSNNVNIKDVKVTDINIASTGGAYNIGGIIGKNASQVTLQGVSAAGKIEGYYNLGGLIGYADAVAIIKDNGATTKVYSSSTVNFVANFNSNAEAQTVPANDPKYLSVGNFIGSIMSDIVPQITVNAAADVYPALDSDITVYTATSSNYTKYVEGIQFYDYIFGGSANTKGQTLIGWSGDNSSTKAQITVGTATAKDYKVYLSNVDGTNSVPTTKENLYYVNK